MFILTSPLPQQLFLGKGKSLENLYWWFLKAKDGLNHSERMSRANPLPILWPCGKNEREKWFVNWIKRFNETNTKLHVRWEEDSRQNRSYLGRVCPSTTAAIINGSILAKRKVWWKFFWGRIFKKCFRDSSSKAVNLLPVGETARKAFEYVSIGILMLGGLTKTQFEGAFDMWKRASVIWSCNVFLIELPRVGFSPYSSTGSRPYSSGPTNLSGRLFFLENIQFRFWYYASLRLGAMLA